MNASKMSWGGLLRWGLLGLAAIVLALTATSLPSLWTGHLGGLPLIIHTAVGGGLVFALPVVAVLGLIQRGVTTRWAAAFWGIVVSGFATVFTVFWCMLPTTPSESMPAWIAAHGWSGLTMPLFVVAAIGFRIRRGGSGS